VGLPVEPPVVDLGEGLADLHERVPAVGHHGLELGEPVAVAVVRDRASALARTPG
jgi:hypothetical protein